MIQTLLILYLTITSVTPAFSRISLQIRAPLNQNVSLPCTAHPKEDVSYRAVRWYKETGVPRLSGLVSRVLPAGQMRWYVGADTRISLEEGTLNLQLPTVTCSDQAVYQCYLAAPVGEQNREGRVRLSVTGPCVCSEPLTATGPGSWSAPVRGSGFSSDFILPEEKTVEQPKEEHRAPFVPRPVPSFGKTQTHFHKLHFPAKFKNVHLKIHHRLSPQCLETRASHFCHLHSYILDLQYNIYNRPLITTTTGSANLNENVVLLFWILLLKHCQTCFICVKNKNRVLFHLEIIKCFKDKFR